jgi:hypothetical protein
MRKGAPFICEGQLRSFGAASHCVCSCLCIDHQMGGAASNALNSSKGKDDAPTVGKYRGVYDGAWHWGLPDGRGTMTFAGHPAFVRYQGQWRGGRLHGSGTMIYCDGTRFEGEWLFDDRSGPGRLFDSKGRIVADGLWSGDKLLVPRVDDTFIYANGDRYTGELSSCSRSGRGRME